MSSCLRCKYDTGNADCDPFNSICIGQLGVKRGSHLPEGRVGPGCCPAWILNMSRSFVRCATSLDSAYTLFLMRCMAASGLSTVSLPALTMHSLLLQLCPCIRMPMCRATYWQMEFMFWDVAGSPLLKALLKAAAS